MKGLILFVVLSMVFSVIMLQSASGFFPLTHSHEIHEACKKEYTTDLAKMCCDDEKACIMGNTLADISVIYYLEKGLKKYTVTHSDYFCFLAIDEARTTTEKAIAAGICLHATGSDRIAHNKLVPYAIEHTGLPNVIIHPFAEQKMEDYIISIDPEIKQIFVDATKDAKEKYTDFFQRVLQPNPDYGDVNVKNLVDGFILQVKNSQSGYDVSFETIKAVPKTIYIFLFFAFAVSSAGIVFIIWKCRKNFGTIFSLILFSFIVFIILLAIIATITGTLWQIFLKIASPIGYFVPTPELAGVLKQADVHTNNLFYYGRDYVKTLPDDLKSITGYGTKEKPGPIIIAEQNTKALRWGIMIIGLILLALLIWWDIHSIKHKETQIFKF
jgi:hypothetical protein